MALVVLPVVEQRLDAVRGQAAEPAADRCRLFYLADLSIAETAMVMGCSEGTVKSTLSDARARLRSELEDSG
ncbi:sigma factor-like helix-turn-helix DNA-binding protein [Kribbella sp. NPDC050281]|uniref:RNA polymerase sigma factor n=1 Tax=Kribbella sp. NPDC050281 TaxID=3155515 RepID=UPI0033D1BAF6